MARASLATYHAKRRFNETPEPKGRVAAGKGFQYTIQKHAARRLHYDLRLELDGVLKSWAVTRGPSLNPQDKRLAVRTEDHPVDYATFEGIIPKNNYGAGTVLLWDEGEWEPIGDPHEGLKSGKLVFLLRGQRLKGRWALIRMRGQKGESHENWLLIKETDPFAKRSGDVTKEYISSVSSGRTIEDIATSDSAIWISNRSADGTAKAASPARAVKKQNGKAAAGTTGSVAKGRAKAAKASVASPARRKRRAAQPEFTEPALATLVDAPPSGENWIFEMKFDGYRALASASGSKVAIYTRSGQDWTARFPGIADAVATMDLNGALLDGEIVAIDDNKRPNFSLLQHVLKHGGQSLAYFVFDLLAQDGKSLRDVPLGDRKERLRALLAATQSSGLVHFSDHAMSDGQAMFKQLCGAGYEGIVAKRVDQPYRPGRSRAWLKIKCDRDQEFIIVGWSKSDRGRPFASLDLAVREGKELRYAGRVGTGFSEEVLRDVKRQLKPLAVEKPPVVPPAGTKLPRDSNWVTPQLVAQIGFAEFTRDGLVRQARFLGLREDKPARQVTREEPEKVSTMSTGPKAQKDEPPTVAGVRLSHPDRVLFPEQGTTKRDLARYLDQMADRFLVHAARRPMSLVRCPEGRSGECFFQRHLGPGSPSGFHEIPVRQKNGGTENYIYIVDRKGLVGAAQMGVLEFHIWGSHVDDVERADRVVFDLDPGEGVSFEQVKKAAEDIRDVLGALDLESFPLLSGGKGIHVVMPMTRKHQWPTVKAFAGAIARSIAAENPDRYVANMRKALRKGRIFIDFFRNDRGSSAIAPFSPRAREGAPLAWPVDWTDLPSVKAANQFRLADVTATTPCGWSAYGRTRQGLKAATLRAVGVTLE